MSFNRAIWLVWWIGTILIALSWFNVVPVIVGWAGFGATAASVLIQVLVNRGWRPPKE